MCHIILKTRYFIQNNNRGNTKKHEPTQRAERRETLLEEPSHSERLSWRNLLTESWYQVSDLWTRGETLLEEPSHRVVVSGVRSVDQRRDSPGGTFSPSRGIRSQICGPEERLSWRNLLTESWYQVSDLWTRGETLCRVMFNVQGKFHEPQSVTWSRGGAGALSVGFSTLLFLV